MVKIRCFGCLYMWVLLEFHMMYLISYYIGKCSFPLLHAQIRFSILLHVLGIHAANPEMCVANNFCIRVSSRTIKLTIAYDALTKLKRPIQTLNANYCDVISTQFSTMAALGGVEQGNRPGPRFCRGPRATI